jgi:hypothetical protein
VCLILKMSGYRSGRDIYFLLFTLEDSHVDSHLFPQKAVLRVRYCVLFVILVVPTCKNPTFLFLVEYKRVAFSFFQIFYPKTFFACRASPKNNCHFFGQMNLGLFHFFHFGFRKFLTLTHLATRYS